MNVLIWSLPIWFHTVLKSLTGYVLIKVTEDADAGPYAPALCYRWHKWDDSKDV